MTTNFSTAMGRAMALTRASDVMGATRAIQQALLGGATDNNSSDPVPPRIVADATRPPSTGPAAPAEGFMQRVHKPLSETLKILKSGRAKIIDVPVARAPPVPVPEGAQFLSRTLATSSGDRRYMLYVPTARNKPPAGLIVMLHGCKQNPGDFAIGTGMNAIAEVENFIVAYPQQESASNAAACWNWFVPAHQTRDRGEPASIAAVTRALIQEFDVPANRVFAAGLSAGGAMAAILAETYPDLYAAVGIHSGLAYGSANDVMSAFSAMRGERLVTARRPASDVAARMILFHGKRDTTVHPSNLKALVAGRADASLQQIDEPTTVRNGRSVERQVYASESGDPILEVWTIGGAGHAWSGGDENGSFADRLGPNASAEMVRFFFHAADQ